MMIPLQIHTPARLHFGLFASDQTARKFGGVGLMIDEPCFELSLSNDVKTSVHGTDGEWERRILAITERLIETAPWAEKCGPMRIDAHRVIPSHQGLGSGTQVTLALAKGLALLRGQNPSVLDLVRWTGRGRRSAVGCHGFQSGGLIIESGWRDGEVLSPIFARRNLPAEWRVVCATPNVPPGLHGKWEQSAFESNVRFDEQTSARLIRWACVDLMSALDRMDYRSFGETLHEFNRTVGTCFSAAQDGVFAHPKTHRIIEFMLQSGLFAVGQTSWGPTAFGIVPTPAQAVDLKQSLRHLDSSASVWIAKPVPVPRNHRETSPQLLVSVRTWDEVQTALAAGVSIIDLKDPDRGSLGQLGAVESETIITKMRANTAGGTVRWSAALGELSETQHGDVSTRRYPPTMILKVGLAGEATRTDWVERFEQLSRRYAEHGNPCVVAAYADADRANAPPWRIVLDRLVSRFRPPVFLVDTFDKSHRLVDLLGPEEIAALIEHTHQLGIHLALAGSLRASDLRRLPSLPDILAIRGAACRDGKRNGTVDGDRIAEFCGAMDSWTRCHS